MFRPGAGLATTVLTLSILAAPLGGAAAQPGKKGGAPAAAPAPRAAPAPAPRAAPAPMVRSAPAARPAPSIARPAPSISRPAPQQRVVRPQAAPRIAAPTARSAPAPTPRAATRVERRQQAIQQRQQ